MQSDVGINGNGIAIKTLGRMHQQLVARGILRSHWEQLAEEVLTHGGDETSLLLPEVRLLALVTQVDEHIGGILFGHRHAIPYLPTPGNLDILVATNRRILVIHREKRILTYKELPYNCITALFIRMYNLRKTITLSLPFSSVRYVVPNQSSSQFFLSMVRSHLSPQAKPSKPCFAL